MKASRAASLGTLHRVPDKTIFKILSFVTAPDLLQCGCSSWVMLVACNAEELWKALTLLDFVDADNKVAQFCFAGSWKETYRLASQRDQRSTYSRDWKLGSTRSLHCSSLPTSSSINCFLRRSQESLAVPSYAIMQQKDNFLFYNIAGMNMLNLSMHLVGVDRRHKLSREEFVAHYEKPNRPVIVTGLMEDWPARTRWQLSNLALTHPDLLLKTNGRSTNGRRFRMRLIDFLCYCDRWNGEKPLYIFDKKVLNDSDLKDDYTVPDLFSEDLFALMEEEDRPDYRWLLLGPNGSGSPFHTDPHDSSAWNAVIEGCKRVSFYPPNTIPPGVDEDLIHSEYYASEDTMEWYRNIYPTLQPERRPIECLVHPGEVLFIPSGWWHQVQNIGHTIAVTQNFCSLTTFPRVAAHMNQHAGKTIRKDFKVALSESDGFAQLASQIVVNKKHGR